MEIRSCFDPVRRQIHVTITEDYFNYEGFKIEDIELGIMPRALTENLVKLGRGGIPRTVKQEMEHRKVKNYLRRFPFLRLTMRKE